MASIFDQYGIKEVCDVTFYDLETNKPVLYLDTLKVSTMEQTAENTAARGGKGNPKLIMWDYNKEINITLEDALFSAKSMAMMFGEKDNANTATEIEKTVKAANCIWDSDNTKVEKVRINDVVYAVKTGSTINYVFTDGTSATSISSSKTKADVAFIQCVLEPVAEKTRRIDISFDKFPGTYKVVGDTYARDTNGKDNFFQLVIPKAKIMSEVTLTMEAEGDPSTFSMNLQVLRPDEGAMVQLIKYDLTAAPSE